MQRIGVDVPESAKMVLLQEDKFKNYYHELKHALNEYDRVTSRILHVLAPVFAPHLKTLELKLRPGMVTLTWTSLNIDAYKMDMHVRDTRERLLFLTRVLVGWSPTTRRAYCQSQRYRGKSY